MVFIRKSPLLAAALLLTATLDLCGAEPARSGVSDTRLSSGYRLLNASEVGLNNLAGGRWMEIARTDMASERGCSRVTMEVATGADGSAVLLIQGWDNDAGVRRRIEPVEMPTERPSRIWSRQKQPKILVEPLRCISGVESGGWIALVGWEGIRILSRSGGLSRSAWEKCHASLRASGQSVDGLIYFLVQ